MTTEPTRDRIVRVAREIAEADGISAVTLRAVGTAAGVSRAAPYRHFRDKSDLLAAVAEDGLRRIQHALQSAGKDSDDAKARLDAALQAYIARARAEPAVYTLIYSADLATDEHPELTRAGLDAYETFVGLIDRVLHDRAASKTAASKLWAATHGAITLTLAGHGTKEKGLDDITDLLRQLALDILAP
ncbi:TetR/AcrR family transcriptional regulator [uncultured Microbacterium sp.]|uniref:TetR/AcrR family transcriptional regulator n=1 Tax=uncultured Microbacterium sp. TaxID=191216 RepID=UPI0035CC3DC4